MNFETNNEKPKEEKSYDELLAQARKEFGKKKLEKILPQYESTENIPTIELRSLKQKFVRGDLEEIKKADLIRILSGEKSITNTAVNIKPELKITENGNDFINNFFKEHEDYIIERVLSLTKSGIDGNKALSETIKSLFLENWGYFNSKLEEISLRSEDENLMSKYIHEDSHAYFDLKTKDVTKKVEEKINDIKKIKKDIFKENNIEERTKKIIILKDFLKKANKIIEELNSVNEGLAFAMQEYYFRKENYTDFELYKEHNANPKLINDTKNQFLRLIIYGGPDFAKNFIIKETREAIKKENWDITKYINSKIEEMLGKDRSKDNRISQNFKKLKDKIKGKNTDGSIKSSFEYFDKETKK